MMFFRVPESPRWLVSKGRHAEALAVLAALDGTTVTDPLVQKTWRGIVDAVRHSAGDFAIKELFTHGKSQHFRRTMLGVGAQCFQQISGIKYVHVTSGPHPVDGERCADRQLDHLLLDIGPGG